MQKFIKIVSVAVGLMCMATSGHAAVIVDAAVECDGPGAGWTWNAHPHNWFTAVSGSLVNDAVGCTDNPSTTRLLVPNQGTWAAHVNNARFSHSDVSGGTATLKAGHYSLFFAISDFDSNFPSLDFEFAGISLTPENCVSCPAPSANSWELWNISLDVPTNDENIGNVLSFKMQVGGANMAIDGVGDLSGLGSGFIVSYSEPAPVPANNVWALLALTMMLLATGWYFRPLGLRRF